jgi:tricorn protease
MDREYYFTNPTMEDEINLTFKRGDKTFDAKYHPESSGSLNGQLYDEWIDSNKKYVNQKSNDKIAYVYMKNMTGGALDKFIIDMTSDETYKKDGLILDIRYNTGGNVHDEVLRFLSQRPYLQWKYRNGKFTLQPNFTPSAHPIVLLVNEQTLSDGEMTSAGFKALKLGKIIGTETYRWIIFTSGNSLVDGSFYRLPSWGCFTLDGKDLEHTGVSPDIYVDTNFKDRVDGKDPQLDKAIEVIKAEWKK